MNMGDRIRYLRKQKGLTQEELGKYIDVKKSAIAKYEKGHVQNMKRSTIETLSALFDVSPSYLMCLDEPQLDKLGNPVVTIPLLGEIKAGYNHLAQENWIGTEEISPELAKTGEFFALKVKGDSMADSILDGDIAIIKKQDIFEDNKISVIIINGDEGTLKLVKVLDNGIKLMPLNRRINPETNEPFYEDVTFTKEEIETKPVLMAGKLVDLKRHYQ